MRKHAKKAMAHKVSVLGKTVPTMLILGLFLVGGTSAALLSSFGNVTGTSDVSQAVDVVGDDDNTVQFEFDSSTVIPPETYNQLVELRNNNDDEAVSFNWASTVTSDTSNNNGVQTGVYEVQTYNLYNINRADNAWERGSDSDYDVIVTPNGDTVTYTVENGGEALDYLNFEISADGRNYQVMYNPSTDSWSVRDQSVSGQSTYGPATDFNEVISTDATGDTLSVTVKKTAGQTFAVHQDFDNDESGIESSVTTDKNFNAQGAIYSDTDTSHHETPALDNLVGGPVETLEGGETQTYNAYTHFQSNIMPGSYTVDLYAEPATP